MNKSLLAISTAILVIVIGSSAVNSPQKTSYVTGTKVAGYTSCSSCHSGSSTAGTAAKGSVTIIGIPSQSIADTSYPISIIIKDPVAKCYGFNVITKGGTFTTTNSGTQVSSTGEAVHHLTPIVATPNPSDSTYTITNIIWKAPATAGAVSFTLAANAANNDGTDKGDHTYKNTFSTTVILDTSLPVSLSSFSANVQLNKVSLIWTTASEFNAAYFSVQRSSDGINFTAVGKVNAIGNYASLHSYEFTDDASKLSGTFYYRLNTIDKDGQNSFSSIKKVQIKTATNNLISIYPNPIKTSQTLKLNYFSVKAGNASVQLVNILGKKVFGTSLSINEGKNLLSVPLEHFSSGVYYLSVVAEDGSIQRQQVIIQ